MKIYTCRDIDIVIDDFCKKTKVRKNFCWHYKYVISIIYLQPYLNRSFSTEDFVPINFELLEKTISKQECANILKNLINLNIIECNDNYMIGSTSLGYRIINRVNLKWKYLDIEDKKLSNKISMRRNNLKINISERGEGYRISNYWFNEIEIDYKRALKYIYNHFRSDNKQQERGLMNAEMIYRKCHFSTVDNKGNRLHTNLSVLPTSLRQFITIDNKELWDCDIANSQPVFLYVALRNVKSIESDELNKYKELVCSGKFYEFMYDKSLFKDLDLTKYEDRSKFKKTIFGGVLFDKNRKELTRWEILFQKEFPTIFNFVRQTKSMHHNSMAIMLQKAESKFIFSTVEIIDRSIKNTILTTIHDCIVSTEDRIYEIKRIMEECFMKEFKILPLIKAKKL